MKIIKFFILLISVLISFHTRSNEFETLIQSDDLITKNLAKNFNIPDESLAYIQFRRDVSKSLDDIKSQLLNSKNLSKAQEAIFENVKKKITESQFKDASNIYKQKNKEAKDFLAGYNKEPNANQIKKITDKLDEMFNLISSKTNIAKNILYDQFEQAGLLNDYKSVKEVDEFITKQKEAKENSSSGQSIESQIIPYILAGLVIGMPLTYLIKNYSAKRESSKLTIDFSKISEPKYNEIQKNLNDALRSKNIDRIKDSFHDLAEELRRVTGKEIYPADLFELEQHGRMNSLAQELGPETINKLRISFGLPIEQNSPVFESIYGKDNTLGKILETKYLEAVQAHEPQKVIDVLEKVKDYMEPKYGELSKSDVVKFMYDRDKDFQSMFKENRKEFSANNINIEKAKTIKTDISSPTTPITPLPTSFKIQEIGLKFNLNPVEIRRIESFKPGEYAKIGEKVYHIDLNRNLVEVARPTPEIVKVAHDIPIVHPAVHPPI